MRAIPAIAALMLALPSAAAAATITLNFGANQGNATFNVANSTIDIEGAASGINARFTSLNSWVGPANRNPGGVTVEDFFVRSIEGDSASIRLELFDDSVGDGYTQLYSAPGGASFDWSLVFYDIDSENRSTNTSFDSILLKTPGQVGLAQDTALVFEQTQDGLLISAEDTNFNSPTAQGVASLSPEEQRYAISYNVRNRSTIEFDYTVGVIGDIDQPRTALLDGGSLTIDNPDIINVAPIPLPAGGVLLLGALGLLGLGARRKA